MFWRFEFRNEQLKTSVTLAEWTVEVEKWLQLEAASHPVFLQTSSRESDLYFENGNVKYPTASVC